MDFYKEWLGIPEGPRPPDHYELLRVKRFEDESEKIRAHYKKLNGHVRKYATGQYSIQSQELLNELAKAMLCLTDTERKRDYDESLGREFPPEKDALGRQPMLDYLIRQGKIQRSQKSEIEEFADKRGLSIRDAVVQMKLVEADAAAQALARELGYSYVDLEDMIPEDSALDIVPRNLVKKYQFLPLFVDDGTILVASVDELDHELEEELRLRYGMPVRAVIALPRAISQAIAKYYPPGTREDGVAPAAPAKGTKAKGKEKAKGADKGGAKSAESKPVKKAGVKIPFEQLPAEEKQQRKQMGILMICASLFFPMLPMIVSNMSPTLQVTMPWLRQLWLGVFLTAPAAISYVFLKYWK